MGMITHTWWRRVLYRAITGHVDGMRVIQRALRSPFPDGFRYILLVAKFAVTGGGQVL